MNQLSLQEKEELYPIIFKNDFNHIEDMTTNGSVSKSVSVQAPSDSSDMQI